MLRLPRVRLGALCILLAALGLVYASAGDRNPTYQHCLRGCGLTYCDPSQPPIAAYLRAFGWSCEDDCKYQCAHSFTDNIRPGSRWLQFYGKWPFYRLGPIQEPFSVLMSLGNLYVNLRGLSELRRRVRPENKLRKWLEMAGWAQVNTWIWSAVFHTRDKPLTERLDYFSATITVAFSLIYAILRVLHLQTPLSTSRLAFPAVALVAFLVLSHFTYLLSFPLGRFPYGYHTAFVVCLGMAHNLLWIAWSLSFRIAYPTLTLGSRTIAFPNPYPPHDPRTTPSLNAMTPLSLVILTILAMSLEVFDFHPIFRVADAHSLWHLATIPLAVGWWAFFCQDALDFEGSLMNARFVAGANIGDDEKMPLASPSPIRVTAGMGDLQSVRTPNTPAFAQLAAMPPPPRRTPRSSPRPSPGRSERED